MDETGVECHRLHILHPSQGIAVDDLQGIGRLIERHRYHCEGRHQDDLYIIAEDTPYGASGEDEPEEDGEG